jgi:hypothetical protein
MRVPSIPQKRYLEATQKFHWATMEQYVKWFTGDVKRHGRTEIVLKRLAENGKILRKKYGQRYVYAARRRKGYTKIYHGLVCTECLIRVYRTRRGQVIQESKFYGCGSIPEWGIVYDTTILLFEFCSQDNFKRKGRMSGKIYQYQKNLEKIEKRFDAKPVVLFVIAGNREEVSKFVENEKPLGDFVFTDFYTFLKIPLGEVLKAKVYFWWSGELVETIAL